MTGRYLDEFAHPRAIAATSFVGLAASYAAAIRRPLPFWELRLTDAINDVPNAVGSALYPAMQLGTLGGPIVVAMMIAVVRRDLVLAAAVVVTGAVTWFAAKGVKRLVQRDRPLTYLPEIIVREGDGSGLGYISGHSAVSASAAIMAMVAIPKSWRPLAAAVAVLVGVARIVHGVHLPADVVGGWSFGVLLGLGGLLAAGSVRDRSSSGRFSSTSSVAP
jgi:membrane-associated phospholipid phosphatase